MHKAEKLFKKVITTFPDSTFYGRAFHSLADTYFEQERYDEARRAYGSALESDTRKGFEMSKVFFVWENVIKPLGEETLDG